MVIRKATADEMLKLWGYPEVYSGYTAWIDVCKNRQMNIV